MILFTGKAVCPKEGGFFMEKGTAGITIAGDTQLRNCLWSIENDWIGYGNI